MLSAKSHSVEETGTIAGKIAAIVRPGDIVLLSGDLGAGKTVFVKSFARYLGVQEEITSPTFALLKEYESGHLPVFHFDAYRLENIKAFEEMGFPEYLFGRGVSIIEWGDKIAGILKPDYLAITIELVDETTRAMVITAHGDAWKDRLKGIRL